MNYEAVTPKIIGCAMKVQLIWVMDFKSLFNSGLWLLK